MEKRKEGRERLKMHILWVGKKAQKPRSGTASGDKLPRATVVIVYDKREKRKERLEIEK